MDSVEEVEEVAGTVVTAEVTAAAKATAVETGISARTTTPRGDRIPRPNCFRTFDHCPGTPDRPDSIHSLCFPFQIWNL